MGKTIYVNCPFCEGLLEISTETGQIIDKWASGESLPASDDKLSSVMKKLEDAKKKRATLFDQTKGQLETQKKKAESTFQEEVERVKKEGMKEKPANPFDLD